MFAHKHLHCRCGVYGGCGLFFAEFESIKNCYEIFQAALLQVKIWCKMLRSHGRMCDGILLCVCPGWLPAGRPVSGRASGPVTVLQADGSVITRSYSATHTQTQISCPQNKKTSNLHTLAYTQTHIYTFCLRHSFALTLRPVMRVANMHARPCRHVHFSDFLSLDHCSLLCCPQTLSWGLLVLFTSAPPHYPHLSYRSRRLDVAAGHLYSQTAPNSPQTLCAKAQPSHTLYTKATDTLCILCCYPWLEIQLARISLLVMHNSVFAFLLWFVLTGPHIFLLFHIAYYSFSSNM